MKIEDRKGREIEEGDVVRTTEEFRFFGSPIERSRFEVEYVRKSARGGRPGVGLAYAGTTISVDWTRASEILEIVDEEKTDE